MREQRYIRDSLINVDVDDSLIQYKQMELNSLLEVTKAINMNSSAENLFKIYGFILQAQMKINRLVVLYKHEKDWVCVHQIDYDIKVDGPVHFEESWLEFQDEVNLKESDLAIKKHFDVMVPIHHKDRPLAYVLIGKLQEYLNESLSNRLNFIRTITNIIVVAIENKRLFKRQIEQERFNKEMELAATVQNMLVPNNLPDNDWVSIDAIYMPHFEIGGDYYDVIEVSDSEILICMADVSGKGISAALLMANFQAMLRLLVIETKHTLRTLVDKLNRRVEELTQGERFLTFFVAKYNKNTRVFKYINAGHPPPIIFQYGDESSLTRLTNGTTIIGAFQELPFLKEGLVENIPANANFILFTDGLTDLVNEEGELFDEDRIIEFVKKQSSQTSKEFNESLLSYINDFKGKTVFTDDITVLSLKMY